MLFAKHDAKAILKDRMIILNYGKLTLHYKWFEQFL